MRKTFLIPSSAIQPLATGRGACLASDMVTVDGRRVAYMYREAPDNDVDSGWRFMSGLEDEVYLNNPDNHGIYDVNTIANYDPDIIPFLDAPTGSAFEREEDGGPFREVDEFAPPDEPVN